MSKPLLSVTAVRSHISSMWSALIKTRMPNSWVPVPLKRTLLEAVVSSLHAILQSNVASNVPKTPILNTLRLLGVDDAEPEEGERVADWFARLARRREEETASEWVDRVSKVCLAFMSYIVGLRFTEEMVYEELGGRGFSDIDFRM